MFIGAQVSLYPMTSEFVDVITSGLAALTPYYSELRIETDDMSTLMVGAPDPLIDAIRDLFAAAARQPDHVTMHVTLSRGCYGEPDDPSCRCETLARAQDETFEERKALARDAVAGAPDLGVGIDVQFSLYVLGQDRHMDEIYGCIEFLKGSGTFLKSKNFCTRLRGDAGAVFETVRQAFLRFGPAEGHVTIDLTASVNSPSFA
ncbi:YkoF family thiamine/hydroxymethylpyrimidine-binding protein [Aurantimonas sp. C2-6-R+9]|uniref:YkoF family thiamine/hydroxymethylpyrimidine-binding protein n=1 Tax=unclassified Aurantimonas TaxID=2638230 RepID=UPI002E19698D|nr:MULTISPECIES: YkoF family thiamine/hydroxymethylpyrimidine-binding protein [unclassified Aurantimonas]MEC5293087.1 YkoF family thiamine/hydroxymethylpyrimidine-binding protein [Aurantimonas sp. C2-3-R2]MEC5325411.1 YkoF family thiamine/hydroxymethylpyrimidine-binding protein [Aurantimonas sp. A3-2-R12]MEC5383517.1 YkoF family thiamine/hydroxymethylpyrimidine-binding protein [Aurantimonas sp. C2-6-R+9]MEC5414150.1 YkoF family thiamine/hydroxymethylpyrimidine-binding protein [Aurantimonas sp. 